MEFTYGAYLDFVDEARARGYQLTGFEVAPPVKNALLLRHDVDTDLESAVHLAEVEQAHGITSTYFVLLTSPLYNPASAIGQLALHRILDMGHVVGLHHDPTISHAYLRTDCERLQAVLGCLVRAVSFHKPTPEMLGADPLFTAPRRHTYERCFITDIDYCSDSTGQWKHGPPQERESYREGRSMQLLTHPEWWDAAPSTPWGRRASALSRIGYAIRDLAGDELGAA